MFNIFKRKTKYINREKFNAELNYIISLRKATKRFSRKDIVTL